jgi:hypothetical protein
MCGKSEKGDVNLGGRVPLEQDFLSHASRYHLPAMARSTSSAVCGSFSVRLISLPL